jgi:uncharacterized membrane protein YtjA (UPF0391 family)
LDAAPQNLWTREELLMLHYALIFFVVALVAAVLGFRGVAGLSANIGYTLLVIAVIFVLVTLLTGHSAVPGP